MPRIKKKYKTIAETRPDLLDEWDYNKNTLDPNILRYGSGKRVWWKCKKDGHSWDAQCRSRTILNSGCPFCNGKVNSENCLMATHPELMQYWDFNKNESIGLSPNKITFGSAQKAYWLCKNSHSTFASVVCKTQANLDCAFCTNRKINLENCVQATHPELIKTWHPTLNIIKPTEITAGSTTKIWWQCSIRPSHIYMAQLCNKTKPNSTSCPYCANKAVDIYNCLATTNPEIAKEWHPTLNYPLTPNDVVTQSGKRIFWQCPKNILHVYDATCAHRAGTAKSKCPYCFNRTSKSSDEFLQLTDALLKLEYKIPKTRFTLDGYHEPSNTGIEFHGTFYHGDPRRFKHEEFNKKCKITFGELYNKTLRKEKILQEQKYNLIILWEIDWKLIKRNQWSKDSLKLLIQNQLQINTSSPAPTYLNITYDMVANYQP